MITSTGNPRIRSVAALMKKPKARREEKCFIVEGPKMFAELPADMRREVYVSESFLSQKQKGTFFFMDRTTAHRHEQHGKENRCQLKPSAVYPALFSHCLPPIHVPFARQNNHILPAFSFSIIASIWEGCSARYLG